MNKYQEAYNWIEGCVYSVFNFNTKIEELFTIKELVKKETPIQVIVNWFGQDDEDYYSYFCPMCNNDLYGEEEKYCPNCGQKLDWFEGE